MSFDAIPSQLYLNSTMKTSSLTWKGKLRAFLILDSKESNFFNWKLNVIIDDRVSSLSGFTLEVFLHPSFHNCHLAQVSDFIFEYAGICYGDFPIRIHLYYFINGIKISTQFYHIVRVYSQLYLGFKSQGTGGESTYF